MDSLLEHLVKVIRESGRDVDDAFTSRLHDLLTTSTSTGGTRDDHTAQDILETLDTAQDDINTNTANTANTAAEPDQVANPLSSITRARPRKPTSNPPPLAQKPDRSSTISLDPPPLAQKPDRSSVISEESPPLLQKPFQPQPDDNTNDNDTADLHRDPAVKRRSMANTPLGQLANLLNNNNRRSMNLDDIPVVQPKNATDTQVLDEVTVSLEDIQSVQQQEIKEDGHQMNAEAIGHLAQMFRPPTVDTSDPDLSPTKQATPRTHAFLKKKENSTSGDDALLEKKSLQWLSLNSTSDIPTTDLYSSLSDGLVLIYALQVQKFKIETDWIKCW